MEEVLTFCIEIAVSLSLYIATMEVILEAISIASAVKGPATPTLRLKEY